MQNVSNLQVNIRAFLMIKGADASHELQNKNYTVKAFVKAFPKQSSHRYHAKTSVQALSRFSAAKGKKRTRSQKENRRKAKTERKQENRQLCSKK